MFSTNSWTLIGKREQNSCRWSRLIMLKCCWIKARHRNRGARLQIAGIQVQAAKVLNVSVSLAANPQDCQGLIILDTHFLALVSGCLGFSSFPSATAALTTISDTKMFVWWEIFFACRHIPVIQYSMKSAISPK